MKKNKTGTKKKHKNLWIICIVAAVLLVALIITLCIVLGRDDGNTGDGTQHADVQGDWENRIADLENEPVSEMDVVYKDKNASSARPYLIQVNKTQNCIIVYKQAKNGKYTEAEKAMICSVGYDTPTGEFQTSDKYEWKIVNGNMWAQYATRIVGNVLFHSMPYASNTKDSLLTNYYNQLGSTFSASCIRLSAKDAQWIMQNCPAGTTVQIYESDKEEPLDVPKAMTVPEDAVWDPTDPDPANPYQNIGIEFEGMEAQKNVERGMQINYLDGVTVRDTCGNDISSQVKIDTNLNSFQPGTYEVKYSVEDAAGKTAQATVSYKVADTQAPQFAGLKTTMNFDSVADVTQDNLLKGVAVIDNNEILDNSRISVVIPTVVEGNNVVTLSVTDDYNNTTTVTVTASVHVKPPVISLKPGMEAIIPLTQTVDQAYALSRVTATDDGQTMSQDKISVAITPTAWGYNFRYTATDDNGYVGTLNDSVSYVEYRINVPDNLTVTNVKDKSQLLKDVTLKNNLGGSLEASAISVTATPLDATRYQINYSYTYTSPLGNKTASAYTTITVQGTPATGTPVSEQPQVSQAPEESVAPSSETPELSSETPTPSSSAEQ